MKFFVRRKFISGSAKNKNSCQTRQKRERTILNISGFILKIGLDENRRMNE